MTTEQMTADGSAEQGAQAAGPRMGGAGKAPLAVTLLQVLLVVCGLVIAGRGLRSVLAFAPSPGATGPLLAASLLIAAGLSALGVVAGWKLLRVPPRGWQLAGTFLFTNLISALLSLLQSLTIRIGGEPIYLRQPEVLYAPFATLLVSLVLLGLLYSRPVRVHAGKADVRLVRSLLGFLLYGFLINVLTFVIFFLGASLGARLA